MKSKIKFSMLFIIVIFLFSMTVYAHPQSQGYWETGIGGGENSGWILLYDYEYIEAYIHNSSYSEVITYNFNANVPDIRRGYFDQAAVSWNEARFDGFSVVSVQEADADDRARVTVYQTFAPTEEYMGRFTPTAETLITIGDPDDEHRHWETAKIELNEFRVQAEKLTGNEITGTFAHEIGHAIGLEHVLQPRNDNQLMSKNAYNRRTTPGTGDINGAAVVSGRHTNHSYTYTYNTTNNTSHSTYCTLCNAEGYQEHQFGKIFSFNEATHTLSCVCSKTKNENHKWSTKWSKDSTSHWKTCTVAGCNVMAEIAKHTYGTGTSCVCEQTHTHNYKFAPILYPYSYTPDPYAENFTPYEDTLELGIEKSESDGDSDELDETIIKSALEDVELYENEDSLESYDGELETETLVPYEDDYESYAITTQATTNYNVANGHWKECDVDGCSAVTPQSPHLYNGGVKCVECGYSHTHSYTYACSTVCNICAGTRTASHLMNWVQNGTSGHYTRCTYCSYSTQNVSHGWASTTNNGSSGHSQKCGSCGYTQTVSHNLLSGTCTYKYCSSCSYTTGSSSHWMNWVQNGASGHYTKCAYCTYSTSNIAHGWASTSYNSSGHTNYCGSCGYAQTTAHSMTWQLNSSGHWTKCNNCAYTTSTVSHGWITTNNGSSGHTQRCGSCGYSQTYSHSLISGTCTYKYCNSCSYSTGSTSHAYNWYQYSSTQHCKRCVSCGYLTEYSAHGWITSNGVKMCGSCGYRP